MHKNVKGLLVSNEFIVIYIIVALSLFIGIMNPAFFSAATVVGTSRAMLVTVIFALCEMAIIISGGIDVSFPAFATFCLYATTKIMLHFGIDSVWFGFLCAAVLGLGLGSINALLIGVFKIPALIATLGTSSVVNGATLAFLGSVEIANIPKGMDAVSKMFLFTVTNDAGVQSSLTILIILPVVLCLLVHFLLRHTMLGRGIYAVGGDANAAKIAGFNVLKIQFMLYMGVGAVIGIAGMTHAILMRNANPSNLMGSEMMVIAAVVIGGTRITGGHGNVLGTLLGVLLIALVSNNLIMLGVPNYWQTFVIGLIIVAGTSITSIRAKRIAQSPKI